MDEQRNYWGVVPGEVLHDRDLTSAAKLLYLVLSSMVGRNGYCWPSNETLGEELAMSKRRVQELLANLQDRGYIRVSVRRSEQTNEVERRYIYCGMFVSQQTEPPSGENPPEPPAKSRTPSCEISQDPHAKSRTAIICKKTKRENIPPISPILVLDAVDTYIGDDPEYREAFCGFLENRAALKNPVKTVRAINTIINRLRVVNHRETEIAMLDNATAHNWLTVYPLKADDLPTASAPAYDEEGQDGI